MAQKPTCPNCHREIKRPNNFNVQPCPRCGTKIQIEFRTSRFVIFALATLVTLTILGQVFNFNASLIVPIALALVFIAFWSRARIKAIDQNK